MAVRKMIYVEGGCIKLSSTELSGIQGEDRRKGKKYECRPDEIARGNLGGLSEI